jgi:hypothetical protein
MQITADSSVPARIFSRQTQNQDDSNDDHQPNEQVGDEEMMAYLPAGTWTCHQILP